MKLKHYQIISLLSGFTITLVFGSLYTLGTIIPYITSFIYYSGDCSIRVVDVSLLYPAFIVSQVFGIFLSALFLQKYFTYRVLSFIAIYGMILCALISSFFKSYMAFVLIYASLSGFIVGCGYMIPMLNCYAYLPHKKGLCSGVCMMAFGVGSLLFNFIFLELINPDNKSANQSHIFPEDVALNVPIALRKISIVYFIIGTIGCLLMIPKPTLKLDKLENYQTNKVDSGTTDESLISQKYQQQQVETNQTHKVVKTSPCEQVVKITPFKQLLKTNQYKILFVMIITSMPFSAFIAFNYKQYGQTISNDDYLITLMGSLGAISNSFSRIFWGWIFDKWSFKTITLIINSSQIIYMIAIIFVKNQYVYLLLILLIYFSYGGVFGIYPAQTARIYGSLDGGRIYSVVFIGFALASVIQFLFHFFIVKNMGDQGFFLCFLIFGFLMLVAQVLYYKVDFKKRPNINQ